MSFGEMLFAFAINFIVFFVFIYAATIAIKLAMGW